MEWIELGNLTNIKTGKLNANAANKNGKYPFFTCADEISWIDEYLYDCECVLVAGNGNLNVKYFSGKFNAYQRTYIIESKDKSVLNTIYLYYFMYKYVEKLRELSIGGVIKYIKLENLTNAKIPVPSLEEQEKIVKILDTASSLIEKRKLQIKTLDELTESIFYDMFGDPVNNDNGWEIKKLGELCKMKSGGTPSRNVEKYFKGIFPWITTVSLGNIYIDEKDAIEFITEEAIKSSSTKLIPKESVMIGTRVGVGKISINKVEMCTNQDIVSLINLDKCVNNIFLCKLIKKFNTFFISKTRGATIKGINMDVVKNLEIISPPLHLQNAFAEKVNSIEKQKDLFEKSLAILEENYNSLMDRAFKGEL